MICPRCGTDATLGAQRCPACAAPFTLSAMSRRRQPARRPVASPSGYRSYQRGSGVGRAVIAWLAVLFLAAVALLALITVFSSSVIKPYVGHQIEQSLTQSTAVSAPTQAAVAAPEATRAGPARTQVITEAELNSRIAEHQSDLAPLDSVTVRILPSELQVTMKSHGVSGTYHGNVVVQQGRPVLTGGRVDGLLGRVIPTSQLEQLLNQQLGAAVAQSGVAVQAVQLQDGQMRITYA